MRHRILAVIVLYRMDAEASATYQSLLASHAALQTDAVDLHIRLHDNSPGVTSPQLPEMVTYIGDSSNSGLAQAYNHALTAALDEGYEWLLTLDQDTALPKDMLQRFAQTLDGLGEASDVGAVTPEIHASGRIVSPNWFAAGALAQWFPEGYRGIPEQQVFAFNSGSLVRVAALRQIGGYSPWFWLDNSDAWLYQQLHDHGKRVFVAGDIRLDHDFSMMNMSERIPPARYETILLAESAFWDMHRNRLAGMERTARLAGRLWKHSRRGDPQELQRLTRRMLALRLFHGRAYREDVWRRKTMDRIPAEALQSWRAAQIRPRVSVCMAVYGGERYLEAQLHSILPQLQPLDEIVIVEDASPDHSAAIVQELQATLANQGNAPTVHLVRHERNQGVRRTFDDAIRRATGDILFLCDDDDVWAPDKVRKMLAAFMSDPSLDIVCSNLALIDADGKAMADDGLMRHRKFHTSFWGNLWHNQFQGSAMAFRASLLKQILPLPADALFLHDAWIGLRAIVTGKTIAFIDEPLLRYRRHAKNYSYTLSRWKQVRLRAQLLMAITLRRLL